MKTFGLVHLLLILILVIAYQCAKAQDYAISTKGDTLKGTVRVYMLGADKKITVQGSDKKKQTLQFFQVKSYTQGGDLYKPMKGPEGYTFMKVLHDGYLSLYAYQPANQGNFDGRYLAKADGSGTEVPNLGFKKTMKKFLAECPTLLVKVEAGTYGRQDLTAIIDEYNACIQTVSQRPVEVAVVPAPVISEPEMQSPESWMALEEKVTALGDFASKQDALDAIAEIRKKIGRNEKVPNFMVEGLKAALSGAGVDAELEAALQELPKS